MTNKRVLMGFIVLMVAGALMLWWVAASEPLDSSTAYWFMQDEEKVAESQGGEINRTSRNVVDVAASIAGTSRFTSLLGSTGVAAELKGKGPYTVFVPTDGAFSLLAPGTVSGMSAAQQKRLVQYHVVSSRSIDPDVIQSGSVTALSRDTLNFDVSSRDKTARVNSAFIIQAYKASNGVVYLISAVLLPPESRTQ